MEAADGGEEEAQESVGWQSRGGPRQMESREGSDGVERTRKPTATCRVARVIYGGIDAWHRSFVSFIERPVSARCVAPESSYPSPHSREWWM
jgi:hypothetical protein